MRYLPFFVFAIILAFISYFFLYRPSFPPVSFISPYISSVVSPTPSSSPRVIAGLVGDLGLGRYITSVARVKKDFSWSFRQISPWLNQNDFNLANLESPIIADCPSGKSGTFTFCGDPQFLPQLRNFVLNLNNNHILNYGVNGLTQTQAFLPQSFYSNFYVKKINGISFGFLGYDFITYPQTDPQIILQKIKLLRPTVDYLIISLHWGNEYLPQPEKWRLNLAHQLIDAGADVIHGHHPHIWQGVETYKDKLIFYSFGNFIFDQSWSPETSHSQIARVIFEKGKSLKYELFPIEIKFNSQPQIMRASASEAPTTVK